MQICYLDNLDTQCLLIYLYLPAKFQPNLAPQTLWNLQVGLLGRSSKWVPGEIEGVVNRKGEEKHRIADPQPLIALFC